MYGDYLDMIDQAFLNEPITGLQMTLPCAWLGLHWRHLERPS
jgi:hypothetical protein